MSVSGDWLAAMTQTQTEKHRYRHTDTQAPPARPRGERERVFVVVFVCVFVAFFSCAVCVTCNAEHKIDSGKTLEVQPPTMMLEWRSLSPSQLKP